ncbi:hypothetical protein FQN54_009914 [Arachnomyces sp. PD_36]|nr:hypothetical protein FQN54_009914 [Arachnomyces sp. PD_36]
MSTSTSIQHFTSPFTSLSSGSLGMSANGATHPQSHHTTGLDSLAEGSQYALQQMQLSRNAEGPSNHGSSSMDNNDPFYMNNQSSFKSSQRDPLSESRSSIRKSTSSAPVRRRISRACDQCNQLRTKCDGQSPCAHCIEFGLSCEYARERKKRGKASKKDLAQQAAAAAASGHDTSSQSPPGDRPSPPGFDPVFDQSRSLANHSPTQPHAPAVPGLSATSNPQHHQQPQQQPPSQNPPPQQPQSSQQQQPQQQQDSQHAQSQQRMGSDMNPVPLNNYDHVQDVNRPSLQVNDLRTLQMMQTSAPNHQSPPAMLPPQGYSNGYNENAYQPIMNNAEQNPQSANTFRFGNSGENNSAPYLGLSPAAGQSPGWLPLPSPPPTNFPPFTFSNVATSIRYPVLQPVLPHIGSIIPQSLACDLLDLYFTSSSSAHMCPQSPYVVGYFFRKQSFLHPTRPRTCTPALLASMLWVAAQTSDAAFLTSPPSARGRVCQKLLELTVGLLKPLIHGPAPGETSPNYAANMVINGVALGGFGVSMDQLGAESSATGAIDDVATYIHLATVVSASEYKAASMRWWTAAWSLARELKLGRELPPNTSQRGQDNPSGTDHGDTGGEMDYEMHGRSNPPRPAVNMPGDTNNSAGSATEEEREERRRIWWLLYIMDRHLALCYNRPLTLLDKECSGLLQPLNDALWQAGDFSGTNPDPFGSGTQSGQYRHVGPSFECTSHSTFGYFLPLMTILGEIVDLNHAKNHPRFGLNFRNGNEWDAQVAEITRQLEVYGQSLQEFEARFRSNLAEGEKAADGTHPEVVSPSGRSTSTMGESMVQTKMVVAYGTHIMHVLHILLTGKWDPISLLDDNDLWISSESFITAMGHAVSAAEAASDILEYDPDLSFMPYFFGVYLLQGSFLLLLTADKLQGDASPSVVRACETIVRAHEACVVTLNTEYQRNFRKVMRSALAQVRGRIPEDFGEQQQRRREVLALYRWTGDGSGLAL